MSCIMCALGTDRTYVPCCRNYGRHIVDDVAETLLDITGEKNSARRQELAEASRHRQRRGRHP